MAYPDSMKIEITRITIYFTPPDTGPNPTRKPRTPIPLVDRIFQNADDLFDADLTLPGFCPSFRSSN